MTQALLVEPKYSEIAPGVAVLRALPTRARRLIGAWCFLDHFGPVDGDALRAFDIGAHPHIGLQTATWLFEGALMHRDSLGSEQPIRAGELNLMTSGQGIAHSETLGAESDRLHGLQFWIALPDAERDGPARFEHHRALPRWDVDGVAMRLFIGSYGGHVSPARVHTPLLGLELHAESASALELVLDPGFEHGLYVATGKVRTPDDVVDAQRLLVLAAGAARLPLQLDPGTRAVLIGGAPFAEPITMWWNFVARSSEEIAAAREDWQHARRFGPVAHATRIPAPPFDLRLRPSTSG
jgi:hypothetical protein